jgi:CubicO group peptidase (beta-lactamase class C family)
VAALDAAAQAAFTEAGIVGATVLVEDDGRQVLGKGYGFADREQGVAAGLDTSYAVASITKQFTAAAVLKLAEQGRLSLDDPLSRFMPELGPRAEAIRVHHLLSHTSGLPQYAHFGQRGSPAGVHAEAPTALRVRAVRFPAGEKWDYNNAGFYVLGHVIEKASGQAFADYLRGAIVEPAGLTATGYCEGGGAVPNRAQDYEAGRRGAAPTAYWEHAGFFAAGGLCASAADLLRWEHALDEGRVLSAASVARMRAPSLLADGYPVDYGLGTRMGDLRGHRKLGHTGGGKSNRSVLAHYPADGLTVIVLMNTERIGAKLVATDIEARLARLALGLGEAAPAAKPLPREAVGRYTGWYAGSTTWTVSGGAQGLQAHGPRLGRARLLWEGGDLFLHADSPSTEMRFAGEGARAERLAVYDNGWFIGVRKRTEAPPVRRKAPARRRAR